MWVGTYSNRWDLRGARRAFPEHLPVLTPFKAPCILRNPTFHYHLHNSPATLPYPTPSRIPHPPISYTLPYPTTSHIQHLPISNTLSYPTPSHILHPQYHSLCLHVLPNDSFLLGSPNIAASLPCMRHALPTVILMTVSDERYNHDSAVFSYCFLLWALNPPPLTPNTQFCNNLKLSFPLIVRDQVS